MGKVILDEATVKNPITLAGRMIGPCYGSDTTDDSKNYKRGLNAIKSGHGRVLEYMECWFILEGYSARVIRQLYTHCGGAPTRTSASTRYIKYKQFDYVIPPKVEAQPEAKKLYDDLMAQIAQTTKTLQEEYNVKAEDANMVLPLGMAQTCSCRFNARTLISMAEQRLCTRAYWEFRELMQDIMDALSSYSEEWKTLVNEFFICKCDKAGYCIEEFGCGRFPKKSS